MARIQINLPEKFDFVTQIPVRIGDINRGVHVSHAAILSFMSEARAQYLISRGCEEQEIISNGVGLVIGDLGIIYKNQASYGQTLKVEIAACDFASRSFDLIYKISDSQNGIEIARAKTAMILFNFELKKAIPITDEFRRRL
jgi:acyl-CoA thioester hydrolase